MLTLARIRDTDFIVEDVYRFILNTPAETFESCVLWKNNFVRYLRRLYDENFIFVYHEGNEIKGLCGWFLTDDDNKDYINKIRWTLPEDITSGDVLYVGFCILTENCEMLKIKEKFKEIGIRDKIKEAIWFRKKWVRLGINENRILRVCSSN